MQGQAVTAFVMRYVLAFIMAAVWLRVFHIALRQWKQTRRSADFNLPRIGALAGPDGREIRLDHDNILGRSRRCDIVLPDPAVAGAHAQIYRRRRTVFLQPLARRGISLNGMALSRRARIRDGDVLRLGSGEYIVRIFV